MPIWLNHFVWIYIDILFQCSLLNLECLSFARFIMCNDPFHFCEPCCLSMLLSFNWGSLKWNSLLWINMKFCYFSLFMCASILLSWDWTLCVIKIKCFHLSSLIHLFIYSFLFLFLFLVYTLNILEHVGKGQNE